MQNSYTHNWVVNISHKREFDQVSIKLHIIGFILCLNVT
jgi:hypothetical protein